MGLGSRISLTLAIFGELFCSVGFIVGAFYRLALIPMIFTMCVTLFVVHGDDPFAVKELAAIYLSVFVLMYISGPGNYALDGNAIARAAPRMPRCYASKRRPARRTTGRSRISEAGGPYARNGFPSLRSLISSDAPDHWLIL